MRLRGRWLCDEMTTQIVTDALRPVEAMAALIARHGLVRVLVALAVAALQRRAGARTTWHLSAHLMRDIGLEGRASTARPWESR